MVSLFNKLKNDHGIAQNQGYNDILQGFNGALQDFVTATSPENSGIFQRNFAQKQ